MDHASSAAAAGIEARRRELAANLDKVRRRIAAACAAAGRDPEQITLIAVTKTFPASDVRLLAGLGVAHVGENRDQEAAPKAAQCADLPLTWHFVGQLQTNKARSVARYADVVHSVDRSRLVSALSAGALRAGRTLRCLVQVSLEEHAEGRGGAAPERVPELAAQIASAEGLELGGVMAVAPLGADPAPAFERLAQVAAELRAEHPAATIISAGMSGDLEQAIACGATHLRIGTALLGGRNAIVR
ncbi:MULTISPECIES: YggS family pyridoxal phosphate-dependent enzyme [Thermomonospora]|uniref:Pyridoxal phosphate homeostasis protein n=1 Tax=Thermomonospora curvata (strain ATCC 19995 / DSM 43183 / JCM 3096 / KCTC 9072 / NBRC 15933 / NCIMB 10081 / Henssen B9) TaxID=471852 RepID=D1A7U2_THECD|nr:MULTISPECIES: YggS family pyridoxal phosphate-dependent enzyme [Thermomonospora]ACY98464.1 alanine racemase domain protein [Thermomonospora curvata DSM 43183]